MAIYTQKCDQKWLKINNRGVGIKISWVENNRGGTIIQDLRVYTDFRDLEYVCTGNMYRKMGWLGPNLKNYI